VNAILQQGTACAERIFEILDEEPSTKNRASAQALAPFRRDIVYKDVSFSYGSGPKVLNSINLTLRSGEVVALVGASGSGKTTLTHLLPRLMDVTGGTVLIDGQDVRDVTMESLRKQIAIVTQDIILFNDTVAYNIAYGSAKMNDLNSSCSNQEIESAAKAANAHDFILTLPHGYDTIIGERGLKLSGGQRQRISIARAVLRNPPILILDEATSSLDTESERLVQNTLERLMENRTVLVVAHRLSTVRRADRILVIEHGQVIEEGTHERLLEQNGRYKTLHQLQFH
jgi:subfamily B ATP-binding cassette protein MsbA